MKNLKFIHPFGILALVSMPSTLIASGQGQNMPSPEEKHSPTVPQKVGRETARIEGQAEEAVEKTGNAIEKTWKDFAHGFKHKRHKAKQREKNQ